MFSTRCTLPCAALSCCSNCSFIASYVGAAPGVDVVGTCGMKKPVGVVAAATYAEAAGLVLAMREGVALPSLQRPLPALDRLTTV